MLRPLFKTDLAQLLVIEEAAHTVPWGEETFKICFQSGYAGWAIEQDKIIQGFVIVSLRAEECHILNLCVAREYQQQGLGKRLLQYALNHAKQSGALVAYLEVRRSNARAITLYKKERFLLIGTRKDYYPSPTGSEDALIFARSLQDDLVLKS